MAIWTFYFEMQINHKRSFNIEVREGKNGKVLGELLARSSKFGFRGDESH